MESKSKNIVHVNDIIHLNDSDNFMKFYGLYLASLNDFIKSNIVT